MAKVNKMHITITPDIYTDLNMEKHVSKPADQVSAVEGLCRQVDWELTTTALYYVNQTHDLLSRPH